MGGGKRAAKRLIDSLEAAKALMRPALHRARHERLYVAHLDRDQRLIGVALRYAGAGEAVTLPVRDIIGDAVRLGTASLVLAHNHPSGDPSPSLTDIDATRGLSQALRPIDVTICDHLVFGGGQVVSFRQNGLL